jgi:general secretion pathway protein A
MYESFFGLKEKPFNLTPDPGFFFMSRIHENAYLHLEYAIRENKGFVAIVGDVGCGKTTLVHYMLKNLLKDAEVAVVNQTNVLPLEFLKLVSREFGLEPRGMDKAEVLGLLHDFLIKRYGEKRRVVLVIDEAQNLPSGTFEEVRMLSNLEADKEHLIQIVLSGQPQLKARLEQPDLEQFVQRLSVQCHIGPLDERETEEYVLHRLEVAGGTGRRIFEKEAIQAVWGHSRGIPRMINVLCDTALVFGYGEGKRVVDPTLVEEAFKAKCIDAAPSTSAPAAITAADLTAREIQTVQEKILSIESKLDKMEDGVSGKLAKLEKNADAIFRLLSTMRKEMKPPVIEEKVRKNSGEKRGFFLFRRRKKQTRAT